MMLCCLYFGVFLLSTMAHTIPVLSRNQDVVNTLDLSTEAVQFAPMLCVLMLAVRMRALQINPYNGNPQWWAQWCFYICTFMIYLQPLPVLVSSFLDAPTKKDDW